MENRTNFRPKKGGYARVAFIAHALLPGYRSTSLIEARLAELGQTWPGDELPGHIKWLNFPVLPPAGSGLAPVRVDFYIIPVMAPSFLVAARDGRGFDWSAAVAEHAIRQAGQDGVPITVGWGAMTKVATHHGRDFVEYTEEKGLPSFSSTHGDAGTAALVLQGVRRAGFRPGFRVAILGANGAIGDAVSRAITALQPESILLVGKADRPGDTRKRDRLEELRQRTASAVPDGKRTKVQIHQDVARACLDHQSDLVIVATTGMVLAPEAVPVGALVIDMTTPSACSPSPEWEGRLVLTSGCGEFDPRVVPRGFGEVAGKRVSDLGMTPGVIWGCTGETIARAASGDRGHVAGTPIPLGEVKWAQVHFDKLDFHVQPPLRFGESMTWEEVRRFVATSRRRKRLRRLGRRLDEVTRRAATF